jgi:glycosyltransferase involved in cell wall biosynthesis
VKLLYITNGINGSGGLERVLSIKASLLAEDYGYEVHIVSLNEPITNPFYLFSPKIHFHNVTVSGNPIKYLTQYIRGMRAIVKKVKPDVISVCDDGLKGFFLPFFLNKPCPMIYERHVSKLISLKNFTGLKKKRTEFHFFLMNQLAKKFDRFVLLTEGNKKEWRLNNVAVIANPLPFFPEEKALLQNKRVIAVGRQSYQKGYDLLLKAWQTIESKHPEWQLDIYGKIDASLKLPEQCENLSISNVHFHNPVKNIQEKYMDSSIYVMSSRFEGFGMVLIEAMACGVTCVSFDCQHGPRDIIRHKQDGFIVPNGDVVALSNAIANLIEDETLRKNMGAKAKENVKRFLPETIVKEWDKLFKSLAR